MSNQHRTLYIAAYDISSAARLRRALWILKSYASGRQKSVFEVYLAPEEKANLMSEISEVIDTAEDRFLLLKLTARKHIYTLGKAVLPLDNHYFYIG